MVLPENRFYLQQIQSRILTLHLEIKRTFLVLAGFLHEIFQTTTLKTPTSTLGFIKHWQHVRMLIKTDVKKFLRKS